MKLIYLRETKSLMAKLLDIPEEDLQELYDYILTICGAYEVDVPLEKEEVKILANRALKDYLFEINQWQVRNQFAQIMGAPATEDFTNKFVFENGNLALKISDWFASMARVGGKTPWKKDYITLVEGKQVYDLSQDSGTPYEPGSRRIHKVMWVSTPEMFGPNFTLDSTNMAMFTFDGLQGGLSYANSPLAYLGNAFDIELLGQSMRLRNKMLRSEFSYNISGDIIEITPMPGGRTLQVGSGSKVFYYYFDEAELLGLPSATQQDMKELIGNPGQVKIENIPYSKLNSIAKNWVDNYTSALCKYTLGSKFRAIKKIASPGSEYQIEFDWQTLLDESKTEKEALQTSFREELAKMDYDKLLERKKAIFEAGKAVNNMAPRLWTMGISLAVLSISLLGLV